VVTPAITTDYNRLQSDYRAIMPDYN